MSDYLTSTGLSYPLKSYDRRSQTRERQLYYAHPLIELCRLFLVFGLEVNKRDMIKATGYSTSHFYDEFKNQREVLRMLCGESTLGLFEQMIIGKIKLRYQELLKEFPPPPAWEGAWERIEQTARENGEIE